MSLIIIKCKNTTFQDYHKINFTSFQDYKNNKFTSFQDYYRISPSKLQNWINCVILQNCRDTNLLLVAPGCTFR